MKINKVNIHAFRLFGDESVDFSAKKDSRKTANFVALYAPNVFGKTSFFDSMEFCMTGKIHRLDDNLPENAKFTETINTCRILKLLRKLLKCCSAQKYPIR